LGKSPATDFQSRLPAPPSESGAFIGPQNQPLGHCEDSERLAQGHPATGQGFEFRHKQAEIVQSFRHVLRVLALEDPDHRVMDPFDQVLGFIQSGELVLKLSAASNEVNGAVIPGSRLWQFPGPFPPFFARLRKSVGAFRRRSERAVKWKRGPRLPLVSAASVGIGQRSGAHFSAPKLRPGEKL
jgi:hypothetical protein